MVVHTLRSSCVGAPAVECIELSDAGAAPLAAITELALLDALELGEGETVLIVGATGGVGSLSGLLSDGALRVPIQASYDLTDAPGALTALGTTHTQGKLAIRVA